MRASCTAVLGLVGIVAIVAPAGAGEYDIEAPPLPSDGSESAGYIGLTIGISGMDTHGDSAGRPGTKDYGGSLYGFAVRFEQVDLFTRHGSVFGMVLELDGKVFSADTIALDGESLDEAPDVPPLSRLYVGIMPAIALRVFKTGSVALSLELGFPLNSDFYGYSAGMFTRIKGFFLGWRVRAGHGWYHQEVLDEQVRLGVHAGSWFIGLDITDGYSEDDMGHANLGSILKGGYTAGSLILGWGQ